MESDLSKRIADLSPEKRELLLQRLKRERQKLDQAIPLIDRSKGAFPLSFAQERLWFLDQLEPGSYIYNIPALIRFRGKLDHTALEYSLNQVIARHESLRTNFLANHGEPLQVIHPQKTLLIRKIDLTQVTAEQRLQHVDRLATQEAQRSFNLEKDLLIAATLFILSPEDHVFLMVVHHTVSDGWSLGILIRELAAFYRSYITREVAAVPSLPIQYLDYAVWQRGWLREDTLDKQVSFWKDFLSGELPLLQLPRDRARPALQTYRSGREILNLSVRLSRQLNDLSRKEETTLFMVLLAAFDVLLCRYSGQDDILVGAPIAGRNVSEVENLIGLFLNTLVFRTRIVGQPTFRELLKQVREMALQVYSNQDVPFEKLLTELMIERDPSRTPIFQVMFNMLNIGNETVEMPGLQLEFLPSPEIGSKFDITLYVGVQREQIHFSLVYNADLFSQARMREFLSQYCYLLEQIVSNPDQSIYQYSLVTENARAVLPDPTEPLSDEWYGGVHQALSRQAHRLPQQLAVVDELDSWTYEELEKRSNQLAHFLMSKGVAKGDIVAIFAHRSASLVWAIAGTLKAGAVFLVLDPIYPSERLIDYLSIARPKGWIEIQLAGSPPEEVLSFLDQIGCDVRIKLPPLGIAAHHKLLSEYSDDHPGVEVGRDDPACVTFTSGSTGRPKGILGRHGSLSHFLPWMTRTFCLTEGDRFTMLSGLSHDPLQRDIFTAFWVGGTILIPNPDKIGEPGWLAKWIREQKATVTNLTPAMGQLIAETGSMGPSFMESADTLRLAFYVGDSLTLTDVEMLRRLAPGVTVVNLYGSTETQRALSYFVLPPGQPFSDAAGDIRDVGEYDHLVKETVPLGKGMPGCQLLVLTPTNQLAGVGELGEIYFRSPHLALGYIGDPKETNEKFVASPFAERESDRLYRTGDLGRYLPDGSVEFAGRMDFQVKVRGFRVELGEIEQALRKHPDLREVVVIAHKESDDESLSLVAYYVPNSMDGPVNARELREFLLGKLPNFMIPTSFVMLKELPLLPNGKINRRALPTIAHKMEDGSLPHNRPRDEVERKLVEIWENTLNKQPVGIHQDFFELGGHSLLATRLIARIEEAFGTRIPLVSIFQSSTVDRMAALIRQQNFSVQHSPLVEIKTGGVRPPFFCIQGFGGGVVGYGELVRLLSPEQPVYGLQARGFDSPEEPHERIEEMAAYYIQAMRTVQPKGPYYLGGYCYGGVVAFEMAQQLYAQGEQVGLLAILEGYAPVKPELNIRYWNPRFILNFLRNIPYWLDDFLKLGYRGMLARVKRKLRILAKQIAYVIGLKVSIDIEDVADDASLIPERYRHLLLAQARARVQYTARDYPGRITLFRVRGLSLLRSFDETMGWGRLAPNRTEVKMISGSHADILKYPQVVDLASQLNESLEKSMGITS